MSKQITEPAPLPLNKAALLETAKKGGSKQTVRKDISEGIKALAEVRNLKHQLEGKEKALVAELGNTLVEMGVSMLTTPEGVVQAVPSKRTDIDKSLLTPEEIARLSKVTEFAKLEVRAAESQNGR